MLAKAAGVSLRSVQRILEAHQLAPHRIRTFKLSNDPKFAEKLKDIVGLYVDPPDHAVVLSVDEKSQIQALDRTQPGLPMKPGRAGTMTHDYKRHGTTTLFAALNVLDGTVIGHNMKRHRHQEFIRFLNTIEARVPKRKAIHAIVDNYATHKHPKVRAWLARHPRWTFHFTPTSASWLNAVESFFAKLTRRRLKRGVFRSVDELKAAINRFLAETNADPKPFVWTADPRPRPRRCQTRETSVKVGPLEALIGESFVLDAVAVTDPVAEGRETEWADALSIFLNKISSTIRKYLSAAHSAPELAGLIQVIMLILTTASVYYAQHSASTEDIKELGKTIRISR